LVKTAIPRHDEVGKTPMGASLTPLV
jgi:hypothetical protein